MVTTAPTEWLQSFGGSIYSLRLLSNIQTEEQQKTYRPERICSEVPGRLSNTSVPDEHIDSLAVVCVKHNMGRTQERLQHVHQASRHPLHLIKNEDGVSAFCQVPLHPALQLPLKTEEASLGPSGVSCGHLIKQTHTDAHTKNIQCTKRALQTSPCTAEPDGARGNGA